MKKVLVIIIIVLISLYATQRNISGGPLLLLYSFLAVTPFVMIFLKKNLSRALLLWFFFAMFNKWGKIPLPMLPDISPERFIWVSIILFFIADIAIERKRKMLPLTGIEISMIACCILIVFSMIGAGTFYSPEEGLTIRSLLTGYFMPFSMFFLAKNIIDSDEKIKKAYIFFAVVGLYLGFTAVCEYLNLWYLVWPRYIRGRWSGIHWGRSRGPFLQAAINGYVQGIFILITCYLLIHIKNKKLKLLNSASLILMLMGLLFSFSRGSWLGFILSSLILPLFLPQTRKIYFACLLLAILVFGVKFNVDYLKQQGERTWTQVETGTLGDKIATRTAKMDSIYGRLTLYGVVWRMFLEKPIFGFGYNTFLKESPKYFQKLEGIPYTVHGGTNVHDTYSGILVELGLVGLILFLSILVQIIVSSIKLFRRLPSEGFLGKGIVVIFWGVLIAFMVNMQLRQMRLFMFPSALFFLMAGIICGLHQRISTEDKVHAKNGIFQTTTLIDMREKEHLEV